MLCAPLVVHVPGGGLQVTPIRNTWRTPVLGSVAKAMRVPSGDQAGSVSSPAASVRFARPVPSALITQTSSPVVLDGATKRIRSPSGDQRGWALLPGPNVSWRGSLPSGYIVHTWRIPPSRSLMKAIRPPPPMRGRTGVAVGVGVRSGVAVREGGGVGVRGARVGVWLAGSPTPMAIPTCVGVGPFAARSPATRAIAPAPPPRTPIAPPPAARPSQGVSRRGRATGERVGGRVAGLVAVTIEARFGPATPHTRT